ncbi:MAG: hypothetical protein QM737_23155 [Ferruginibacter sp.]
MKIFFTIGFILFCFFSSLAQTDAKVEAVYTLGKIPAPLGVYRHKVQARIVNKGTDFLFDLPVTLTVTGANSFADNKTVNIAPGDTSMVDFDSFSPWNMGTNTVTVSVPADDDNSDNSSAYTQLVNNNDFSYSDNSVPVATAGFGTSSGILLTKYSVTGSAVVSQVKTHLGNQSLNAGNTIYAVVMQSGAIVAQSLPHLITLADLDTDLSFDIVNPPAVDAEFMVGIVQTQNATTAYYPVACQYEGIAARPDAYYASFEDGSGLGPITNLGRFMIEAVVSIGTVTPFNIPAQPNYVLAGWDLTGTNSPITTPATIADTILSVTPLLTRGPAAMACAGTNSFFTTGFDDDGIATTNNDYFQFEITAKMNDTISLNEIDAFVGNSTNMLVPGVSSQFAYSTDGINFTLIGTPLTNSTDGLGFYLGNIPALQNVTGGNTITFRYYASGPAASADWGFLSTSAGKLGLSITGRSTSTNKVLLDPVIPGGADFTLNDCTSSPSGSINFTTTGVFSSNNNYIVELGRMYQPTANIYLFLDPVVAGTLSSNANAGTINFTIPPGTNPGDNYVLRITSTEPHIIGSYSQPFNIYAPQCHSQPTDRFRSKTSGDWSDINTWESSSDGGANWIAATLAPDDFAFQTEIVAGHTVEITTHISSNRTLLKGTLKVLNGNGNNGRISISNHVIALPNIKIDTSGVLQIVSSSETLNSVINQNGYISVAGKICIGDGVATIAGGFEGLATGAFTVFWLNGSVFEWNGIGGNTPAGGTTYFPNVFSVPTFRLTNVPGNTIDGNTDLLVNGLLEVNTPITMTGSGTKTFRDGIIGSASLTQDAGCGKFIINSVFGTIPATSTSVATRRGVIDGTVAINVDAAGMTLEGGITIPSGANISIAGKCHSLNATEIQEGATMTLLSDTLFLDDANLVNAGTTQGANAAAIQFTGTTTSLLSSPGSLLVPLSLLNKQLQLGSNSNVRDINLAAQSNITLVNFDLNMGTANLVADSANFIVTNNTGRLSRYTTPIPVLYPVGVSSTSYTPVTISNTGNEDNIKVRVGFGVDADVPVTNGNVNRTWFVGDTAQTGTNLTMQMQWNELDEQPGFERSYCHVSHYTSCQVNCNGAYYDPFPIAEAVGTTSFTMQRSGFDNFSYPSFIVTSKPFVYTFTGDGNWEDAANWSPALVAPTVIPAGIEVYIDPIASGQCVRNGDITVQHGAKLAVQPGKQITVTGNLNVE